MLRRPKEDRVSKFQPIRVRLQCPISRHADRRAVHFLKAMPEHRPVDFVEQLLIDSDFVLWSDAEKVAVECRVVDLAQCHPVWHDRIATVLAVTNDVRGIEQFNMSQTTDGATRRIRLEDSLSKDRLMEALLRHCAA